MTQKPDTVRTLRAQLEELAAVNDGLVELLREQRTAYQRAIEGVLLVFVARGYQPAARALLEFRRVFDATRQKGAH